MDLNKAFDSVCHNKLIKQLNKIGVEGKALILFKSYLFYDLWCPPRHSIIPVTVMKLSNLKIEGSLYSYADDTALIVTGCHMAISN